MALIPILSSALDLLRQGVGAPIDGDPTGLTATFVSATQIELNWTDNATNERGYYVERKVGAGDFIQIAKIGVVDTETYLDNTVVEDAVYTYRVRAYNKNRLSAYSNESSAETLPAAPLNLSAEVITGASAPAAPTLLTVTFNAEDDIELNWTDNSDNETEFIIERSDDGGAFEEVGIVGTNVITFTDDTAETDTLVNYRVIARNAEGDSDPSNEDSVETLPGAPTLLTATAADDDTIDLAWDNEDVDLEDEFKIERKTGAGAFAQIDTTAAGVLTYQDTGLDPSTTYTYRVRGSNATGNGAYSNEASDTTAALLTAPNAPTNFVPVFVSNSQIDMTWTDASADETGFKIERSDDGGAFTQIATPAADATSYSDTTVAEDTAYVYRMRAVNAAGNSAYTPEETVYTQPAQPTDLTATAISDTQIQLSWTDNSDIEDDFRVQRKTGAGSFTTVTTVASGQIGYLDTGLTASTTYTYRVQARRTGAGELGWSNEATETTMSGENLVVFSGDYPSGFTVASDEIGVISGTVTSGANVVVHGTLRMRPGSTLRFTGIDNSTWSFDSPDATHEPDESDVGLWFHGNAVFDALGTEKTPWLRATGSISAGATTITVGDPYTLAAEDPVGWLPGDEILISPTAVDDYVEEIRVIESVSGNTVTLTSALSKDHPSVVVGDRTFSAEICNLTRDVRVEGTSPTQLSHIMFMDHDPPLGGSVPQTIKYVQFRYLGRHKNISSNPDVSGRYALHFHRLKNSYHGSLLEGLVARDGKSHQFVSHETHGLTWRKCIATNGLYEPYWWDHFDPSLGPPGPSTKQNTSFSTANDLLYDECISGRNGVASIDGSSQQNMGQFNLLRGTNVTVRNCVGFGRAGTGESGTFEWQDSANVDPNAWIFENNVAHNNQRLGARVWQNDSSLHRNNGFYVYHCGAGGLAVGAYGTMGYRWNDFHLVGRGSGNGIRQHTSSTFRDVASKAAREADGYYFGFRNGTVKSFGKGVSIPRHQKRGDVPTLYYNIQFSDLGVAAVEIDEVGGSAPQPGLYDFVDCTVDGLPMDENDVVITSSLSGMTLRIQNGSSAISIDYQGNVTEVAPFFPKTGLWDPAEIL